MMNRIFIVFMALCCALTGIRAQDLGSIVSKIAVPQSISLTVEDAHRAVLAEDFDKALYIYNKIIDSQKKNRSQGSQVNNEIMSEYAYLLAITGAQELALVNIDIALNLKYPSPSIYYYVGSILDLIGFSELAIPYIKAGKQPSWLHDKGTELNRKYRSHILLPLENRETALKHISQCIKDSRFLEAACYATYLTQLDAELQSAWLLQSAALEKLGNYTYALQSYETGLALSADSVMPGMSKQLAYLQKKAIKQGNSLAVWQIQSMVYGGLTYSNGNTSINGRYGISSGPLSMSANISLNIPEHGKFSSYTGLSCFYNIGKLFAGTGMGFQSDGTTETFSLSPTIGLSFINAKLTSSFDISIVWNIPCRSGMKSSLGISIGKTFYFNSNDKRR